MFVLEHKLCNSVTIPYKTKRRYLGNCVAEIWSTRKLSLIWNCNPRFGICQPLDLTTKCRSHYILMFVKSEDNARLGQSIAIGFCVKIQTIFESKSFVFIGSCASVSEIEIIFVCEYCVQSAVHFFPYSKHVLSGHSQTDTDITEHHPQCPLHTRWSSKSI